MSLLDANMVGINAADGYSASSTVRKVAFQTSKYMLLTIGLLILLGNTW